MKQSFRLNRISLAVAGVIATVGLSAAGLSYADAGPADAAPERVVVTGEKRVQATDVAPSQISLDAVQPQSIMGQKFIEENAMAGSNYADLINLMPSVFSVDPNGSGLMESQSLTIRGFQDGQYNVTFDGIPWADSNDFTHHSTVYFMPQDLNSITVDRGPGQASTIGEATYGGTIALTSKDPSAKQGGEVFGAYGSWATGLLGVEYNTGVMHDAHDAKLYVSVKGTDSNGFLTQSNQERENIFVKYELPLAAGTKLTLVSMLNHTIQHIPYGATPAQQAAYGYNFGLVTNSQSEANSDYNYDLLKTDFEYVGLKSTQGNWAIDNKLYTYGYYHQGYSGFNPGSVTLQDTINDGGTTNGANHVPGQHMHNNYRSFGDILRASQDLGAGNLELGIWMDRQTNDRIVQDIDWTLGGAPYNGEANGGSIQRNMFDTLTTFQPYAQFAWKITPQWTVTPGVKYDSFKRDLNATVNQKTELPYNGAQTWSKTLPSLDTHYAVTPATAIYATYSEGFLAPNLNVFYKTNADLGSVKPTTTKNYQIGSNTVTNGFILGADVYRIDSTNVAAAVACPAGFSSCDVLVPGVKYDGLELEATYKILPELSIYANVAKNNYSSSNNAILQNTPTRNAALGLIYQEGDLYSSLMAKYVGSRYSNTDASGNNLLFGGYVMTNFDLSYKMSGLKDFGQGNAKVSLKIGNLLNRKGNFASLNSAADGSPLLFVLPTRNYQVSLAVPF